MDTIPMNRRMALSRLASVGAGAAAAMMLPMPAQAAPAAQTAPSWLTSHPALAEALERLAAVLPSLSDGQAQLFVDLATTGAEMAEMQRAFLDRYTINTMVTAQVVDAVSAGPDWLLPVLLRIARALPDGVVSIRLGDITGADFGEFVAEICEHSNDPECTVLAVIQGPVRRVADCEHPTACRSDAECGGRDAE